MRALWWPQGECIILKLGALGRLVYAACKICRRIFLRISFNTPLGYSPYTNCYTVGTISMTIIIIITRYADSLLQAM